jgi:hypothetical protein
VKAAFAIRLGGARVVIAYWEGPAARSIHLQAGDDADADRAVQAINNALAGVGEPIPPEACTPPAKEIR